MRKIAKTKVCRKCGKRKSMDGFCRNNSRSDGFCIWCKKCSLEVGREFRLKLKSRKRETF